MTARLLPRDEWGRLAGTELAAVADGAQARGREAHVFVVEDAAGAIVGCWSLFQVWHAEGIWIAPEARRRGGVARALLTYAATLASALGITHAMTAAQSAEVATLLDRLHAQPLPGAHYLVPLTRGPHKEDVCQPLSPCH